MCVSVCGEEGSGCVCVQGGGMCVGVWEGGMWVCVWEGGICVGVCVWDRWICLGVCRKEGYVGGGSACGEEDVCGHVQGGRMWGRGMCMGGTERRDVWECMWGGGMCMGMCREGYCIAGNFREVKIFAIFATHNQNTKIRTAKI